MQMLYNAVINEICIKINDGIIKFISPNALEEYGELVESDNLIELICKSLKEHKGGHIYNISKNIIACVAIVDNKAIYSDSTGECIEFRTCASVSGNGLYTESALYKVAVQVKTVLDN